MFSLNEKEEPVSRAGVCQNEVSPASKPDIVSQFRAIFQIRRLAPEEAFGGLSILNSGRLNFEFLNRGLEVFQRFGYGKGVHFAAQSFS